MILKQSLLVLSATLLLCDAKIYERCELAKELRDKIKVPEEQLATWVCIAHRESNYDTSAVGTLAQGKDNGIFQISDLYWCEQGDVGGACGLDCASLLDDNISDDYTCARRIHRAHQRLQGDGFKAWAVYGPYCSGGRQVLEAQYTNDCFSTTAQDDKKTADVQTRLFSPKWWYYDVITFANKK